MTKHLQSSNRSRRRFLMVSARSWFRSARRSALETLPGHATVRHTQGARSRLRPDQLSSYIGVDADATAAGCFGKMDMGDGLFVAIGQMVAEELDVPFKAVRSTWATPRTRVNQGGASGSTGIQLGGKQLRMAAAERAARCSTWPPRSSACRSISSSSSTARSAPPLTSTIRSAMAS